MLTSLGLSFNYLTGPMPSELGNLINLESLILGSGSSETNRLAGPLPPELGNLRHLGLLALTGIETLVGALPATLMALTQLESLYADGTGLCAPRDPDFQAWLRGISNRRVDDCDRMPSMAYLTQAVQSRDFGVPLVAGENALLRVFPIAQSSTTVGIPKVRAHFYRSGRETYAVDIPGKSTAIPTSLDEGDLSKSANADIPGSVIQPGLEMVIEIDPDSTLDPYLGVTKRIPEVGRLAVRVEPMPRLDLTQIPFLWSVDPDSTIIHQIDSMAADHDDHELLWGTRTLLPVGDLQITAHEPVLTSTNHGSLLLSQTASIRALEGGTGHYMGMMSGKVIGYAGIAYLGGRSSFSFPSSQLMAHELGHNLNLLHAPCGGPGSVDQDFPNSGGLIGVWAYDSREEASLVPPATADLMSYCHPRWISDYHFTKALRFRMEHEAAASTKSFLSPAKSLLVWGGVGADGTPFLEPVFVIDAPPLVPQAGGAYQLIGRTDGGAELFSLNFGMPEIADGDGRSSFAFVLPVRRGWAGSLASITLSGPGGSVTLDGDSELSMAILRNPMTGQVRAIIRDLPKHVRTWEDAAVALPMGSSLELRFSRGVPDAAAWMR